MHRAFSSRLALSLLITVLLSAATHAAEAWREGEVLFEPAENEETVVPEPFRQAASTFTFREEVVSKASPHYTVLNVTFPSPVTTPHVNNNTVHCEYFRPNSAGPHPGCIVLHILGGDFELSRLFCRALAQEGVAAMFVKMPYYGPRRQPEVRTARMIAPDPKATVAGMTQAVLDIRRAAAWLRAQEEIDAKQVGIFGISLGGITGALTFTAEPRFHRACLVLAGGDVSQVADQVWSAPQLRDIRERWEADGGTRDSLFELMSTIDPVKYGTNVAGRPVLMLNAKNDEIIPPKCSISLWKAFGHQEIVWYNAGHITAAFYILDCVGRTTQFFQSPES